MAFFDNKGRVCTIYVPRGKTGNANCFIKALHMFMKLWTEKCPEMSTGEGFFDWDNVQTLSARAMKDFLAQKSIQMLKESPLFT
jgi:O-acetyl-ADP-ribose deacetylase (regulator of RNase III)